MAKQNISTNEAHSGSFRDRASSALGQFSDSASSQVDNSPLIALAGGIAIGALIAAVLPQTDRESELLQPAGSKLTDAGRAQIDRAREAGKAKVDELAGDKLRDFFGFNGGSASSGAA
jgi:broad specificity phosphatase PhoE